MAPNRPRLAVLACSILTLVVSACGGSAVTDTTASESSASTEGATDAVTTEAGAPGVIETPTGLVLLDEQAVGTPESLVAEPPGADLSIGATLPHFKDPYWIAEAWGVQRRADELGVQVEITNAGGYGETTTQVRQIEDFITQGVDILIVGAVDQTGVAPVIDQAWDQGIPVIYTNSIADSKIQTGTYTYDCLVGEVQAEYISDQQADAKIVMFTGPPGVAWPAARSDCFKAKIAELAPDAEILTEEFHDMDPAVILETMEDILQTFPEIDFVYNNTDLQAKGAVNALRAAGYAPGEVKVTTLTLGREAFGLMEDGWIDMALAERPVLQGALAVDIAVRLLAGDSIPALWVVDHPLYSTETLDDFIANEEQWNWEPEDWQP